MAFAQLLRQSEFPISSEQVIDFLKAVALLGPRSMDHLFDAARATFGPSPDRGEEFALLFRRHFYGEVDGPDDGVKGAKAQRAEADDAVGQRARDVRREKGGTLSSAAEVLSARQWDGDCDDRGALSRFRRLLGRSLPARASFRMVSARAQGQLDLRRSLRTLVRTDGDVPCPRLRRRKPVQRNLLVLIDISGSMKLHTADYLNVAHAIVRGADRAEVFTLGTRLTRITAALRPANPARAFERVSDCVEDWDGGTRIGSSLGALVAFPRFAAFARGAAILILSDALERGSHEEMERAIRQLSRRAFRLSLATPLAADPQFQPETAALRGILPVLDDLIDGSSISSLTRFILALGTPGAVARDKGKREQCDR
ncbi:VWA domain-containing protein [Xanthobacter sp. KR7-225]|uniref:VWA domain-containing protein n=1 Tax=Xanthobacter sp. KR7-225 TaxID=3156613 RepID=UPI0032B371FF